MKTTLRAMAIVAVSICAGIVVAYFVDRGLRIRSKPVALVTPFAAAIVTGVALLKVGKPSKPAGP